LAYITNTTVRNRFCLYDINEGTLLNLTSYTVAMDASKSEVSWLNATFVSILLV